jgi:hypothetical protein
MSSELGVKKRDLNGFWSRIREEAPEAIIILQLNTKLRVNFSSVPLVS